MVGLRVPRGTQGAEGIAMRLGVCLLLLAGCGSPFTAAGPDLLERDGAPDVATAEGGPQEDDGGGDGDALADGEGGQVEAGAEAGHETSVEACAPIVHSNGVGQTWQDCAPLGTYDGSEAMAACAASGGSCQPANCAGGALLAICAPSGSDCTCWTFYGPGAGHVRAGVGCACALASDPVWR